MVHVGDKVEALLRIFKHGLHRGQNVERIERFILGLHRHRDLEIGDRLSIIGGSEADWIVHRLDPCS